jgi:hypothetical protein
MITGGPFANDGTRAAAEMELPERERQEVRPNLRRSIRLPRVSSLLRFDRQFV